MNSRDRFNYLIHQHSAQLDRIPIDFWAAPEIDQRLCRYYKVSSKDALLDRLDVDFRYIEGPKYIGPSLKVHADGSEDDLWGVPRKKVYYGEGEFRGSLEQVVQSPLELASNIDDVRHYSHWPNPDWYDYSVITAQCDAVHSKGRIVMFMGDRLNRIAQLKPTMYLYGVERTLAALARKTQPIFDAIVEHLRAFYTEYLRRILQAAQGKIDVLVTGDDFGQQNGLLCRPSTWREKLLPGFTEFIQTAKKIDPNIKVMHHTCGSVRPIIGDMVTAGLDILNPIQPGTFDMEFASLKQEWGNRLIFHGGINLQGPLRFGNPHSIDEEVQFCCKTLGNQGGYIICTAHNLNADIPTANIIALFNAYQKYTS
jgi:uroporphyrinogen decarboxylase